MMRSVPLTKALTDLVIRRPFHKHLFPFLCKTPNIETLKLHFEELEPFEHLNLPSIMPKLTTLEISEWDGMTASSIAHLFESLELPTLSNLCFNLDNEDSDSTVIIFPKILPCHHCCGIMELTVTTPWDKVGKVDLIDMLAHFKNMEHLTISAKIVSKDLLSALIHSNHKDDILPELHTFNLRDSESIPDHKILLQMVESCMKDQTKRGEQEGVMLEEVYLDEPLTFDEPSMASR